MAKLALCVQTSTKVFKLINPEGPSRPLIWTMLPVVGGVTSGIIALSFPEILYQGYGNVNALLELRTEDYAPPVLLQMLAAKVFATAVCRGSGLVGGIYAPSIFMGTSFPPHTTLQKCCGATGCQLHQCVR